LSRAFGNFLAFGENILRAVLGGRSENVSRTENMHATVKKSFDNFSAFFFPDEVR